MAKNGQNRPKSPRRWQRRRQRRRQRNNSASNLCGTLCYSSITVVEHLKLTVTTQPCRRLWLASSQSWKKPLKIKKSLSKTHPVINSFHFKFAAHYSFSHAHIKSLFSPSLSQRWSAHNNLTPGVIFIIFNYVWVPESLWG